MLVEMSASAKEPVYLPLCKLKRKQIKTCMMHNHSSKVLKGILNLSKHNDWTVNLWRDPSSRLRYSQNPLIHLQLLSESSQSMNTTLMHC